MKATKEELQQKSTRYQASIESEFAELKSKASSVGKIAAVVGAGFFVSYLVVRAIRGGKKHVEVDGDGNEKVYAATAKVTKNPTFLRTISGILMTEVAVFVVGIAKDQFVNFINKSHHSRNEVN